MPRRCATSAAFRAAAIPLLHQQILGQMPTRGLVTDWSRSPTGTQQYDCYHCCRYLHEQRVLYRRSYRLVDNSDERHPTLHHHHTPVSSDTTLCQHPYFDTRYHAALRLQMYVHFLSKRTSTIRHDVDLLLLLPLEPHGTVQITAHTIGGNYYYLSCSILAAQDMLH